MDSFSALFNLPPELRNKIWRHVLVSSEEIIIDSSKTKSECLHLEQPTLLRTNRQVRAEGLAIYYSENQFVTHVHHLKGAAYVRFTSLVAKYAAAKDGKTMFDVTTKLQSCSCAPKSLNLLKWIKAAYYAGCEMFNFPQIVAEGDPAAMCDPRRTHVTGLSAIAYIMKSRTWVHFVIWMLGEIIDDIVNTALAGLVVFRDKEPAKLPMLTNGQVDEMRELALAWSAGVGQAASE